jgi:trans-2,3-dihydro-3-hydroxyanthranilate isomerase
MRTYEFETWDVFTETRFGGNPLGIFPSAQGLTDTEMQSIARELNLSETVFLLPPQAGGHTGVRIFTPGFEVPFAGHPTVGTACFLADAGRVALEAGHASITLEEKVGPVPVTIRAEDGRATFARLTTAQAPSLSDAGLSPADAARIVRLSADDLASSIEDVPCHAAHASAGLPYLVIPVKNVESLGRAELDDAARAELVPMDAPGRFVYLVAPTEAVDVDYRVRMFAPEAGVPEDPATGSAAAALGAYLGPRLPEGLHRRVLEQGIEMGRPSRIELEVDVREGAIDRITVGGHAVPVTRGTLELE